MIKKTIFLVILLFLFIPVANSFALDLNNSCYTSSNPYYNSGYGGQCTAFAWGRACEKYGIDLRIKNQTYPSAKYWYIYGPIDSLNLTLGSIVQPNSIAVWKGDKTNPNGHVAYVERVENGYVYFNEANVSTYCGASCNWRGGGYDGAEKSLSEYQFEHRGTGVGTILGYIYLSNGSTNPGDSCGSGMVYDCSGNCVSSSQAQSWIGDGYCDNGQYGMVLTCDAFNNDDGDCNTVLEMSNVVFDFIEDNYGQWFPPRQSTITYPFEGSTSYYRYYPSTDSYLFTWIDGYLWYNINDSGWNRSASIEDWYNYVR